jgi:glycosyltransferase involved in cell wall biosynthesis/O-antigen/teichoic acid export membrane protein
VGRGRETTAGFPTLINGLAFSAGTVVRMSLGFLTWLAAARLYPATQVGLAASAIASMMICLEAGLFGIDIAMLALYPAHRRNPARLLNTALTLAAISGGASSLVFFTLAAAGLGSLHILVSNPANALLFLSLVVFALIWWVMDQVSISLKRSPQVLLRAAIASVLTLSTVVAFGAGGMPTATGILAAWVVGATAACSVGIFQIARATGHVVRLGVSRSVAFKVMSIGLPNYALTAVDRAPALVLPIVAAQIISPRAAAYWYSLWMMATAAYTIALSYGLHMFADVSAEPTALVRHSGRQLRAGLAFATLASAGLVVVGPFILSILGHEYAVHGANALRLAALAAVPMVVTKSYLFTCRATHRIREGTLVAFGTGVVAVGASAVAAGSYGLTGMAAAWLVIQAATGIGAAIRRSSLLRDAAPDAEYGNQEDVGQPSFSPIAVAEAELSEPLTGISPIDDVTGLRRGGARVLVRLHSKSIGVIDLDLGSDGISAAACAAAIWERLGERINAHLREDGIPEIASLDEAGIAGVAEPRCLERRRAILRDPPWVTVFLATRNRPTMVVRALEAIEDLDYPRARFEIVLVDGSEGDETEGLVRTRFPDVNYMRVRGGGYCVTRNRGIAAATGDVIAFTDDDAVVDRHWLVEHLEALETFPDAACTTGRRLPLELNTPAQVWFEEFAGFTGRNEPRVIGLRRREPGSLLPWATGKIGASVNMAWRASLLREVGGFDVALDKTTGDDLALFFDGLSAGHEIAYTPSAIVYHEHRRTHEELRRQVMQHSVGLGAYLTRCLTTRPSQIPAFLRRIPRGTLYAWFHTAPQDKRRSSDFPADLVRAGRWGVLLGPYAYLKGVRAAKRLERIPLHRPARARR